MSALSLQSLQLEYIQELLKQIASVAGILSGFAFAIIIQLISMREKKKSVYWTLCALIVTESNLLITTCIGAVILFVSVLLKIQPPPEAASKLAAALSRMNTAGFYVWLFFAEGLIIFMVGIGTAGWIHSKVVGFISTVSATV